VTCEAEDGTVLLAGTASAAYEGGTSPFGSVPSPVRGRVRVGAPADGARGADS
jgi:hypothetical protein